MTHICEWCGESAADRVVAGKAVCGHCFPWLDSQGQPLAIDRTADVGSPGASCPLHAIALFAEQPPDPYRLPSVVAAGEAARSAIERCRTEGIEPVSWFVHPHWRRAWHVDVNGPPLIAGLPVEFREVHGLSERQLGLVTDRTDRETLTGLYVTPEWGAA